MTKRLLDLVLMFIIAVIFVGGLLFLSFPTNLSSLIDPSSLITGFDVLIFTIGILSLVVGIWLVLPRDLKIIIETIMNITTVADLKTMDIDSTLPQSTLSETQNTHKDDLHGSILVFIGVIVLIFMYSIKVFPF